MLLTTAALLAWAAAASSPSPAAPPPDDTGPRVQLIALDTTPWDTNPAGESNWGPAWGTPAPVEEDHMVTTLGELELQDGTIVRLYATADNLIDGAFLRPGQGWVRFVQLFRGGEVGPNYAVGATLTACENILGQDGFLLRTDGYYQGTYDFWYYWFDEAETLQVLRATTDPVPLDLDGDGAEELAFNFDSLRGGFSFYYRQGAEIYRATAGDTGRWERLDPGPPIRLRFTCQRPGGEAAPGKTLSFTGDSLRVETGGPQPPSPARRPSLPPLPQPVGAARPHVAITAPEGWVMDGGDDGLYDRLRSWLEGDGLVLRESERPLDAATAYTVAITPRTGGRAFTWTLDAAGTCRFGNLEGTYRLERTSAGSPAAACHQLLAIACQASRTSRDYDDAGRHLGRSLAWDIAAGRDGGQFLKKQLTNGKNVIG